MSTISTMGTQYLSGGAALIKQVYTEWTDMTNWYAQRSRDIRTAELALQGWRPVKTEICDGIYHDELQLGFGVCMRSIEPLQTHTKAMGQIYRLGKQPVQHLESIEWDGLTAMVLYKLLLRLEQA